MYQAREDQPENVVADWVGRKIGGYAIDSIIGQGGMATVFRAYQPQLDRWVAIKILQVKDADNELFLASFRREAKAIAALRHPNILTVYDYGEEEGTAYIVMEYIAGGTLEDMASQAPIPWSDAADLIIPVGHALTYAHSQGIVHCDVKPSNVLLAREDWPLLADFGLLRLRDQEMGKPGMMSGTPTYASPEQIMGQEVGQRSDVYSLALILYQLLTGQLPFEDVSLSSTMLQRLLEYPTPPSTYRPELDPRLEEILLKALSREPEKRFQSMEAMVSALTELPEGQRVHVAEPEPAVLDRPSSTKALSEHPITQGPHLVVTGTGTVLSLPQRKEVILGRVGPQSKHQPDVDLGPHGGIQAGVSRQHARLRYAAEGWLLEDLESTNGTSLNMAPVEPGKLYRIRSGDVIRCGRLMLVFFEK